MAPATSRALTRRQRDVMELIDRRVPIKVIADELGISPTRVNQHIRALKDIYGADSLNDLVESYRNKPLNGGRPGAGEGMAGRSPDGGAPDPAAGEDDAPQRKREIAPDNVHQPAPDIESDSKLAVSAGVEPQGVPDAGGADGGPVSAGPARPDMAGEQDQHMAPIANHAGHKGASTRRIVAIIVVIGLTFSALAVGLAALLGGVADYHDEAVKGAAAATK